MMSSRSHDPSLAQGLPSPQSPSPPQRCPSATSPQARLARPLAPPQQRRPPQPVTRPPASGPALLPPANSFPRRRTHGRTDRATPSEGASPRPAVNIGPRGCCGFFLCSFSFTRLFSSGPPPSALLLRTRTPPPRLPWTAPARSFPRRPARPPTPGLERNRGSHTAQRAGRWATLRPLDGKDRRRRIRHCPGQPWLERGPRGRRSGCRATPVLWLLGEAEVVNRMGLFLRRGVGGGGA